MRLVNLSRVDLVVPASAPRLPPLVLPRPRDRAGAPVATPELVDALERAGSLAGAKAWGTDPEVIPAPPPFVRGRAVRYILDREVALWVWAREPVRKADCAYPVFRRYQEGCFGLVVWATVGGVRRTVIVDVEAELIA